MNTRDLEYFKELAQVNSFTAVANHFHVSQPTVTYAVKRLEEFYGCDLILKDPSHRAVVLTDQGHILEKHAEHILDELGVVKKAIEHSSKKQILMGFPQIIRARILSQLLPKHANLEFMGQFKLISEGSSQLLKQLLSGDLDFSLMGSLAPLTHPDLEATLLFQREFSIVVSSQHPIAQKKEIRFEDTLDYPFILLDEGNVHMQAFQNLNEKYHNRAQVLLTISDVQTIGQMVKENLGISYLTDFVPFLDREGLVQIPLAEEDKQLFYVHYAYLKNTPLSEPLQRFIAVLEEMREQTK